MNLFPRLCCGLLLILLSPLSMAQGTRAFLDREEILLGESVTLNIETDQPGGGEPDLSALGSDVRVLGSSSSTQISVVNGQQSMRTLWGVVLEPLSAGVIGIPALEVRGQRTAPLRLSVLPASARPRDVDADVLLEVEAAPENPYVQQQVIYTVRLLYAVTLLDGQLDEPSAAGADIRRLGGDATFSRDMGGRRYNVVERRYALTPLASGSLRIEAPRFRGRALAGGRANRMFDPGTPVSAAGDAVSLDVRPRPASAGEPWLPAQSLDYSAQTSAAGTLRIGEPVTLSLRLSARGLSAEQLPELVLPAIEGAEVYPDQEASQSREGPRGIEGERSRSFAVVPNRAGTLELPRLVIRWWDVAADEMREAVIEAQRFAVEGGAGGDAIASAGAPDRSGAQGEPRIATIVQQGVHPLWRLAALLQLPLLLLFAGLCWRARARSRTPTGAASVAAAPPPQAGPSLAAALRQGELSDIAQALRGVARARGLAPELSALVDALDDAAQRDAVDALQRSLYAGADGAPALQALRSAFVRAPEFRSVPTAKASSTALPPLYPPRGGG
ncbi:BatD family protein [Aquimonas voraii]|uniref:Oxygen tolerance n=1 Tax=Aquimonas voraii TaxID=265719 RepID=A0A1G6ZJ03_9GAMM|nr:BatD family protein [Aquimonas voraii]SDE02423.1 Oxygen tolerance [Aquimonas voraii]